MSKSTLFVSALATSVIAAGVIASPALAWHPKGVIVKYVQNQTTSSVKADANTAAQAVAAKPGDILKYTIEIRNDGAADARGWNDMAKTVMTDTLPAGVELVGSTTTRTITVDLGTLKPGQKIVKEYAVKVTAAKDGVIENKACFTGNSTANDNPQKGCDVATVKVTVPPAPVQPQTPPATPVEPSTPQEQQPATPVASVVSAETPAELPNTGSANVLGGLAGIGSIGYAAHRYASSKRQLRKLR